MKVKVSDFIVEYLIDRGITDVFGYPGGMVTHLMESFRKYGDQIAAHIAYHEQGAAMAACGYAQVSGKVGVAYATSGPGATNLITGICNAYFDSIPTLFLTGQVNTAESKGELGVRQRGFQETDIVSMVQPVTKYAVYVECAEKIKYYLDTAFEKALEGRTGPVLLDIPMDIFRTEIETVALMEGKAGCPTRIDLCEAINVVEQALNASKRPCFIIGNGVKSAHLTEQFRVLLRKYNIPVVTSMPAFDVPGEMPFNYGFIGAYGNRTANFVVAKCDLLLSVGSRLDVRQVGGKRENFAPDAKLIRFDVDAGELEYPVHANELQICLNMEDTLRVLDVAEQRNNYSEWIAVCDKIRGLLQDIDKNDTMRLIEQLSGYVGEDAVITTDVGQNQVWVAQAFRLKKGQTVLFSGGHGAMGYALPAAIGACYANDRKTTFCISGDGGLQMNIQELQFIVREKLPIKIIVLNNNALGMIRHFQEMYFDGKYYQTKPEGGYTAPDFSRIAKSYGIPSCQVSDGFCEAEELLTEDGPALVEVLISGDTYVFPKLEFGKPNQDQEPLLDRALYERIMKMDVLT